MKKHTIVSCSEFGDITFPRYFLLDGDYSHLDKVVINCCEDKALEEELITIIFDNIGECFTVELQDNINSEWLKLENFRIIHVGFAP